MAKSIKVNQKRGRGRPATGRDPLVSVRLPEEFVAAIDHLATTRKLSRSDIIREVVEQALATGPATAKHDTRMAPQPTEAPGMERDNRGNEIPMHKRTKDDREKVRKAKR